MGYRYSRPCRLPGAKGWLVGDASYGSRSSNEGTPPVTPFLGRDSDQRVEAGRAAGIETIISMRRAALSAFVAHLLRSVTSAAGKTMTQASFRTLFGTPTRARYMLGSDQERRCNLHGGLTSVGTA